MGKLSHPQQGPAAGSLTKAINTANSTQNSGETAPIDYGANPRLCRIRGCGGEVRFVTDGLGRLLDFCPECERRVAEVAALRALVQRYERALHPPPATERENDLSIDREPFDNAAPALGFPPLPPVPPVPPKARKFVPNLPAMPEWTPATNAAAEVVAEAGPRPKGWRGRFDARRCRGSCRKWFWPAGPRSLFCGRAGCEKPKGVTVHQQQRWLDEERREKKKLGTWKRY